MLYCILVFWGGGFTSDVVRRLDLVIAWLIDGWLIDGWLIDGRE